MSSDYNNNIDLFQKLGLSKKEAGVYFELIKLGASPVSVWAKHAKINRSSMYVVLERLLSRKLINTFVHQGVKHAQAVPMSEIVAILYDKQKLVEQTRDLFIKNMPNLQMLEKNNGLLPKVVFYEGKTKVKLMYENVIEERQFKSYFNPDRIKKYMPEYFHKIPLSLKENKGSAKELLISSSSAKEYISLYGSDKHQIEELPDSISFFSDTIITDDKIFLVGYSDDNIVGTEIWNRELAQTQSVLFDVIWNGLKNR